MVTQKSTSTLISRTKRNIRDKLSSPDKQKLALRKSHVELNSASGGDVFMMARMYSEPTEREDSTDLGDLIQDCSNTVGFLSITNNYDITKLEKKLEDKNKQKSKLTETPYIILALLHLKSIFPSVPESILRYLIVRYDGNCAEVYEFLLSRDWQPVTLSTTFTLIDKTDCHFTTPYYHGAAPCNRTIQKIFKTKPIGSYITFYRGDNNELENNHQHDFKYYLCYKNRTGKVIEKPMRLPMVPEVLFSVLDLTVGIPAPTPGFSAIPWYPQNITDSM